MLGSRVCWQLLLGWALLLGQPVFGYPDATGETSLEEAEEPMPVPKGAEALKPELPKWMRERRMPTSDEMLEMREVLQRDHYESQLSKPWSFWVQTLKQGVLDHHQKNSKKTYKPFENAYLRVKEAIGTMIYLKMMLVETNCTNAHWSKEEDDHSYFLRKYRNDRYPRHCEPQSMPEDGPQMQDCTFTIFDDARTKSLPVVISHKCRPVYLDEMESIQRSHNHIV